VCRIELDHDADSVRAELRCADIRNAASRLPVITGGHAEHSTLEIHYDAVGRFQREVVHFYRSIDTDHDLGAT
jgi:hypothetical protein